MATAARQQVAGMPNVGNVAKGAPMVWAKPTRGGLGLVKLHMGGSGTLSLCGALNLATSRYAQPGYKPLHVAYATNAAGVGAAVRAVPYANNTMATTAACTKCVAASPQFAAMVATARVAAAKPRTPRKAKAQPAPAPQPQP